MKSWTKFTNTRGLSFDWTPSATGDGSPDALAYRDAETKVAKYQRKLRDAKTDRDRALKALIRDNEPPSKKIKQWSCQSDKHSWKKKKFFCPTIFFLNTWWRIFFLVHPSKKFDQNKNFFFCKIQIQKMQT